MSGFIKINSADNVAVAIHDVEAGCCSNVDGISFCPSTRIPAGHKVALADMVVGTDVIKYGFPIGHLTSDVKQGDLIDHTNIKTNLDGILKYTYDPDLNEIKPSENIAYFK